MMKVIQAFFRKYRITILVYIGIIALYAFVANNRLVNAFLFPTTTAICKAFLGDLNVMRLNLIASLSILTPAILISLILALIIGIIMGSNKGLREALHPVLYTISVVPSILLSPFALLLAPSFRMASLFLIVYESIWSTVFGTITGIMTIDKRYLDKADVLKLRGLKRYLYVILPAASPSIIPGFINSLSGTFVMLVYAEMYGAEYGMGYYVRQNAALGLYDKTWAGFIFMIIVLVIVMQCFEKIRNRILHWTM